MYTTTAWTPLKAYGIAAICEPLKHRFLSRRPRRKMRREFRQRLAPIPFPLCVCGPAVPSFDMGGPSAASDVFDRPENVSAIETTVSRRLPSARGSKRRPVADSRRRCLQQQQQQHQQRRSAMVEIIAADDSFNIVNLNRNQSNCP